MRAHARECNQTACSEKSNHKVAKAGRSEGVTTLNEQVRAGPTRSRRTSAATSMQMI